MLLLLYPRKSKEQEFFIEKAEERLVCSQSEKEDCSTQTLNLFHVVRKSSASMSSFTIHLILPENGGIVDSSLFCFI